jgi:hypothetical protein
MRLLPSRTFSFRSNLSPTQLAERIRLKIETIPPASYVRPRFRGDITHEGFEITRVPWGGRLFRAQVYANFSPSMGGSMVDIVIKQSTRVIYLLVLLSLFLSRTLIFDFLDRVRQVITGAIDYEQFMFVYKFSPFPLVMTFMPVFMIFIGLILSWILFPIEAWKAQRYLDNDLGFSEFLITDDQ